MIINNFAQHEVSTAAYDEQQTHLWSIVIDLDHMPALRGETTR
jgi:hypothetical protein